MTPAERVVAAHMFCMMPQLLERPDLDLDYALQEAVAPDLLCWEGLTSNGKCNWVEAAQLVTLVGIDPAYTYLILSRDVAPETSTRFCQMTGGMYGRDLLVEIGEGNDVAIVSPAHAGFGRRVPITESDPWEFSTADEYLLLPREAAIPIAFDWLIHGELDSGYRLRPVPTYPIPTVNVNR